MKIKKRYLVACILICLAALALSVGVCYFEVSLSRYAKLNKVVRDKWNMTSAADPNNAMLNSDLFVTRIIDQRDTSSEDSTITWGYIGSQNVVDGKYMAYGKEVFGGNIVINDDVKIGERITVYYKPDNPTMVYCPVSYTMYIVLIALCVLAGVGLIFVCRLINKRMKDNTFSDANITFMDIPMGVIVVGIVVGFFLGMLIGNLQVNKTYTSVDQSIAQSYANGEYQF